MLQWTGLCILLGTAIASLPPSSGEKRIYGSCDVAPGRCDLNQVVQLCDDDVVRLFVQFGADVNGRDTARKSPLHYAVESLNLATVAFLLDSGAAVNAADVKGETPLHWAARHLPEAIPVLLKKGANKNARDSDGMVPLHWAAQYNPESVPLLLNNCTNVNSQDNDKYTPLHRAVQSSMFTAVKDLLFCRADISARDKHDNTPLDLAWPASHTSWGDGRKIFNLLNSLRSVIQG